MSMKKHLSSLGENAREIIAEAASAIRSRFNTDVREIGEHLTRAKAALRHGAFGPWLAQELGITPRTAQNYMQAAAFLAGKSASVSHLPTAIVYKLSAPTTLPVLVNKVIEAGERGDMFDIAALKKALTLQRAALSERKNAEQVRAGISRQHSRRSSKADRERQALDYDRRADTAEAELAALVIVKGAPA